MAIHSLRSSLSSTRKLFQRTVERVKSLFTERTTYQRLPKLPHFQHFYCQIYRELDNVVVSSSPKNEILDHKSEQIRDDHNDDDEEEEKKNMLIERRCLVAEKLKDLEMIDSNNFENVQDIEEVLHLYPLLTCPVYIDMFDKFVMDMYSDIFNLKASSDPKRNSTISSRVTTYTTRNKS